MVPMLTCGLLRSNFAFATAVLLRTLLMRHATSGTDCGRQGVGGWIWTGIDVDPGPVTVRRVTPPSRLWRLRTATHSDQSVPLGVIQLSNSGHRLTLRASASLYQLAKPTGKLRSSALCPLLDSRRTPGLGRWRSLVSSFAAHPRARLRCSLTILFCGVHCSPLGEIRASLAGARSRR